MKLKVVFLASLLTFTLIAGEPAPAFELRLVRGSASPDSEQLTFIQQHGRRTVEEKLYIQKKPLLDQSALQSAALQRNPVTGNPEILVTFTEQGAQHLAKATRDYVGERLAMVIDGRIYSAPKVKQEILGGKAVISGSFSEQEATRLATRLREVAKK